MRFIDQYNKRQPDFLIELNLEQSQEKIHRDILEFCKQYEPEVLIAEGKEADCVIDILSELGLSYGGLILKYPTRQEFPLDKLKAYLKQMPNARYSVRFVLSQDHPQFSALNALFVILDENIDFETHVNQLLHTYFLIGMNEE